MDMKDSSCLRKVTFVLLLQEFLKFTVDRDIMSLGATKLAVKGL